MMKLDGYSDNYREFECIFGVPLKQFWDKFLGFDLLKFDDNFIKSGDLDGVSMEDVVRERFGEDGVRIVKTLISAKTILDRIQ